SNHYNLNHSLARKNIVASARCSCGYETADINYLVFVCSKYDDIRKDLHMKLNEVGASSPDCVWSWLRKEELSTLRVVYEFLMKTGRII
ncbi:hypothetical protein X777_07378, partial [Ooceraea biroi]